MFSEEIQSRAEIRDARRWVIKIGSAVLTDDGRGLDRASIQHWVEQIVELRQQGKQIAGYRATRSW